MTLFIEFGSLLNFKRTLDFNLLFDELWIDRQIGLWPRRRR